jgi:hypothetical protein
MAIHLVPKFLNISCTLVVVHDHLLGWDRTTGEWLNGSEDMKHFPYGLDISTSPNINSSMRDSNSGDVTAAGTDYNTTDHGDTYGGMNKSRNHKKDWFESMSNSSKSLYSSGTGIEQKIAARDYSVSIIHIPSQIELHFKALLTGLSDGFQTRWDSQSVYGRMDPVKSFQGTSRTTSISWDLVSSSKEEAVANLRKVSNFAKMLYPMQSEHGSATTMISPPMMAIKFTNLVSQGKIGGNRGLTGTLNGFTFSPDLDAGFFEVLDTEIGGL